MCCAQRCSARQLLRACACFLCIHSRSRRARMRKRAQHTTHAYIHICLCRHAFLGNVERALAENQQHEIHTFQFYHLCTMYSAERVCLRRLFLRLAAKRSAAASVYVCCVHREQYINYKLYASSSGGGDGGRRRASSPYDTYDKSVRIGTLRRRRTSKECWLLFNGAQCCSVLILNARSRFKSRSIGLALNLFNFCVYS